MAITASQAQGLVLALFGASAGAHLTGLTSAASVSAEAADLVTAAGLVLDQDLSSNATFRDLVLVTNLKLTGTALTAAQAWMDGEFTKGTARGDIIAAAVTFLDGLTDTTNTFYATAAAYRTTVANAVTWSQGAGATVTSVATLMAQQGTASNAQGQTFTLTTGTDTLIGTSGNDTFNGTAANYAASDADQVIDTSTTDNDTYNLSLTASATPKATNVENINVTFQASSAQTLTASSLTGAKTLTVTGADYTVGGSTITGNKDVAVASLDASKVAKVVAGAGSKAVTVTQATVAGATVDASVATGAIVLTGAATLDASATTSTIVAKALAVTAQDAKALTIKAGNASQVDVQDDAGSSTLSSTGSKFAGAISVDAGTATSVIVNNASVTTGGAVTVNAAKASTVSINSALGGATVNAATANISSATITVNGIDNSGASVTAGTGSTTKTLTVALGGTSATDDVATVSAAGAVTLNASNGSAQVDTVNLSGNGAAVTYTLATSSTITNLAIGGTQTVNITGTVDQLDGKTLTGAGTVKLTTKSTSTTATTLDFSKLGATKIDVNADLLNSAGTPATMNAKVANGATLDLTANQSALKLNSATAADSITVKAGDSNGASNTATPTTTFGAVDVTTVGGSLGKGTVNLVATDGHLSAASVTGGITDTAGTSTASSGAAGSKAQTALVISGNKNVILDGGSAIGTTSTGVVIAKSIDASSLTGALQLTAYYGSTVTGGSAGDYINVDSASHGTLQKYTVDGGAGDDNITITKAASDTTAVGGDGDDTVTIASTATATYVISTGAGNDTVNLNQASGGNIVVAMGDGTSDKVVFGGAFDYKGNADFSVTDVEIMDITAAGTTSAGRVVLSSTQFAKDNTFKLVGNSTSFDILKVINTSTTAGATINASSVTFDSSPGASLELAGAIKADTITGSGKGDVIIGSAGADSIDGGAGTDTVDFSGVMTSSTTADVEGGDSTYATQAGMVFNFGSTAVTASTVSSAVSTVTASEITSIAAGQTAYLYSSAETKTKSAVQQSIANVESVIGTGLKDYIVASSSGMTIAGNAGDDYIKLGSGADTVVFAATATNNGTDTITGFAKAADIINLAAFKAANAGAAETTIAAGNMTTGAHVYQLGGLSAGSADSLTAAASAITAGATWTSAAVTAIVILSDDNSTSIYQWAEAGTAGAQASELTLMGTIDAAMTTAEIATATVIV